MTLRVTLVAAVAAAAVVVAAPARATMEGHEVSTVDPFAACVGVGADGMSINYPDSEVEPWVATNPANPDNMIGAWQQDRWSGGGARGLVAGWSFDDGLKWGETPLPFSKCADPYYGGASLPFDRASDERKPEAVAGVVQ